MKGGGCHGGIRTCSVTTTGRLLFLINDGLLSGVGLNSLGILLVFVDGPVEDVVVLESLTHEQIPEDLAKIGIVGLVVEAQRASVVQIDGELVRKSTAEDLGRSGHLLLHDAIILLLLRGGLQSLPWEGAAAEVEHDVSERLHVITA